MAKYPERPEEIFEEITADFQKAFDKDLESILLYGSAAGGDYRPGRSDLNFLVVLTDQGIENLDKAFGVVERWRKRRVAVPIFVTEKYIVTSLDVFPIEYLDMKRRHVKVFGRDVLEPLEVDRKHLRLQCEREVKGKLLLLREGYLDTRGKARGLKEIIKRSIPAFTAIFQALLFLKDVEIPSGKSEIFRKACHVLDLNGEVFSTLIAVRDGREKTSEESLRRLFKDYLKEVGKLATVTDSFGG